MTLYWTVSSCWVFVPVAHTPQFGLLSLRSHVSQFLISISLILSLSTWPSPIGYVSNTLLLFFTTVLYHLFGHMNFKGLTRFPRIIVL